MKIYFAGVGLASEYSSISDYSEQLKSQRLPRKHVEVSDPSLADLILFTDCHLLPADWRLWAIRSSDIAQQFPDRVAIYNERDRPWCCLPGIFVSMPASSFVPRWQVAASYHFLDSPATSLGIDAAAVIPDLLFSFIGARTHRCREVIFGLNTERSYIERTDGFMFYDESSDRYHERRLRFAEIMVRSKFVLCPRGHGTSSFRLYETMSEGRVPVIIADHWVPPGGPTWEEFSIRWPESRIQELPAYLSEREADASEMGDRARNAYEKWFAHDVTLTHSFDQLEQIMGRDGFTNFPRGGYKNAQFFRTLRGSVVTTLRRVIH